MQTEAVAYIAGRSETLSVLLIYAALAVFLYRRDRGDHVSGGSIVLVLFCLGSRRYPKSTPSMLPFLLLLTDYYWNPGFSFEGIKKNWRLYALVLGGCGGGE